VYIEDCSTFIQQLIQVCLFLSSLLILLFTVLLRLLMFIELGFVIAVFNMILG